VDEADVAVNARLVGVGLVRERDVAKSRVDGGLVTSVATGVRYLPRDRERWLGMPLSSVLRQMHPYLAKRKELGLDVG
jgi:hypothetical protein